MTIPGIFSQRDARWSGQELGFNIDPYYNIYHFGCAVDGIANILWWVTGDSSWTPERVNSWLVNNGGFVDGGGLIIWEAVARLLAAYGVSYHGFTTDLTGTNSFLSPENNFALAQLKGPGFPMHFSAMPYVGQIADSWDAVLKPVGAYTFVGAHLYTKLETGPAPVVPPVVIVPIQAPVVAPLPDPAPAPVPSNPQPQPDPTPMSVPIEVTLTPGHDGVSAEVEVKTPQAEFVESFDPFNQPRDVILVRDTAAIDMAGTKPPVHLVASKPHGNGGPFKSAGTFMNDGRKYYRGTSGSWFGVPDTDVFDPEAPAPVPAAAKPKITWAMFFKDPFGVLIRLFSKS